MEYTFSYREKNGSVCLILSYKVGRKWKQKTKQGFKTQREARQHQDELLEQVKAQTGLTTDATLKDISLREFFQIFSRDKEHVLTYHSIKCYGNGVDSLGDLADVPMRELTTADITNAILRAPGKLSTKKTRLRYIAPVLEHAVTAYQIISSNPARGVKLPKDKTPRKIRAFTREELTHLLKLTESCPMFHLFTLIAAHTGMRFGEIAGLPWSAVDWRQQTITIHQQFTLIGHCRYGIAPCKTANSNRVIPASPAVLQALARWKNDYPIPITGTVFPLDKMDSLQTNLNQLIRKHFPGRSIHALRHTFATLLLSKTGDINLVAGILGDRVTTVSEIYVDYTDDIRRIAAQAIGNLF